MNTWWKRHLTSPVVNYLGRRRERASFSKGPILIGGCARSGTSLLLSALSAHPAIYCFPHEVDAFTSWVDKKPQRLDRLYRYLLTHKISESHDRWCEKRPFNVRYIGEILEYMGSECRIIHIVRDPRAVCSSIHPERPNEFWVSPERWINDVGAGLAWKNHPQVLTVKYEDLVQLTQQTIGNICDFLDEERHPHILDWFNHATVRKNRAWDHQLEEMSQDKMENWRSDQFAEKIEEVMGFKAVNDFMLKLGYSE